MPVGRAVRLAAVVLAALVLGTYGGQRFLHWRDSVSKAGGAEREVTRADLAKRIPTRIQFVGQHLAFGLVGECRGVPATRCMHLLQASADDGVTWQPRGPMITQRADEDTPRLAFGDATTGWLWATAQALVTH